MCLFLFLGPGNDFFLATASDCHLLPAGRRDVYFVLIILPYAPFCVSVRLFNVLS